MSSMPGNVSQDLLTYSGVRNPTRVFVAKLLVYLPPNSIQLLTASEGERSARRAVTDYSLDRSMKYFLNPELVTL